MTDFIGTSGNDTLVGTGDDDTFDMSQGGDDSVSGGAGDDSFSFGAALTAADSINGGTGSDVVVLEGAYTGLVLAATTLTGVEEIDLTGHFNYALTTNDANVAAGQVMDIDASDLAASSRLTFDGSHETDGAFAVTVITARAHLIGGAGDDTFTIGNKLGSSLGGGGGGGGDTLTGGAGADHFVFLSLGKVGAAPHEITDLTNTDVIDISNLDANTLKGGNQAFHLVHHFKDKPGDAVLSYDSDTNKTSLMLDTNGDGKADAVIQLDGHHTDFTNFVL
jgi:Ca2+-binding RTX toxin-like protein